MQVILNLHAHVSASHQLCRKKKNSLLSPGHISFERTWVLGHCFGAVLLFGWFYFLFFCLFCLPVLRVVTLSSKKTQLEFTFPPAEGPKHVLVYTCRRSHTRSGVLSPLVRCSVPYHSRWDLDPDFCFCLKHCFCQPNPPSASVSKRQGLNLLRKKIIFCISFNQMMRNPTIFTEFGCSKIIIWPWTLKIISQA